MSPRAIKRRLAQHAEKSKLSPMPSIQLARKHFNENLALAAAQNENGQKKVESMHQSPSKVMLEKAMKEMEQQSVYSGKVVKKRTLRNFHRWVEQTPEEPLRKKIFTIQ